MKLRDIGIGTQLRVGIGVILALVVLLGVLSWGQARRMWQETAALYEHSVEVRRAIGALQADMLAVHGELEDALGATKGAQVDASEQKISVRDADASRQMAVLFDCYPGSRDDLARLQVSTTKYMAAAEDAMRWIGSGNTASARLHLATLCCGGADQVAVTRDMGKVDESARLAGDGYFTSARASYGRIVRSLLAVVAGGIALALLVSWLLVCGIKHPLEHLTAAANEFRQGRTDARSGYVSHNEFGVLSASFNGMADTVEAQMLVCTLALLSDHHRRLTGVRGACGRVL